MYDISVGRPAPEVRTATPASSGARTRLLQVHSADAQRVCTPQYYLKIKIVSESIHAVTTTNSTADASSTSSTSALAVSTDSATNSSTTAVSAESTTGTTAVAVAAAAAAATATPTAAGSKAQGLVGKLAGILGKRAPGEEGLETRIEQRVRRSRVFAGVRA